MKYARKNPRAILVNVWRDRCRQLLHLRSKTIGSRFGGIPSGLPKLAIPHFHYEVFRQELLLPGLNGWPMNGASESLMSRCCGFDQYEQWTNTIPTWN